MGRTASGWNVKISGLLLVILACEACKLAPLSGSRTAGVAENETLDWGVVLRGALHDPGSPERKEAGQHLQEKLGRALAFIDQQMPAKNAQEAKDRQITKNILRYTVDYMKSGQTCNPSEKVRVYRGIGKNPGNIFGQRLTKPETGGVNLAPAPRLALRQIPDQSPGGFYRAIMEERRPLLMRIYPDEGKIQLADQLVTEFHRFPSDTIKNRMLDFVRNEDLGLAYVLGYKRMLLTGFPPGNPEQPLEGQQRSALKPEPIPINLSFPLLAREHSSGPWWHIANPHPYSFLLSTSVSRTLPMKEGYGPRYLVMDVCPERALLMSTRGFPEEKEVYLPFFAFPEEIAEIVETDDVMTKVEQRASPLASCLSRSSNAPFMQQVYEAFYGTIADESDFLKVRGKLTNALGALCPPVDANDRWAGSSVAQSAKVQTASNEQHFSEASGDFPQLCALTGSFAYKIPGGNADAGRLFPLQNVIRFPARPGASGLKEIKLDFLADEESVRCEGGMCKHWRTSPIVAPGGDQPKDMGTVYADVFLPASASKVSKSGKNYYAVSTVVSVDAALCK